MDESDKDSSSESTSSDDDVFLLVFLSVGFSFIQGGVVFVGVVVLVFLVLDESPRSPRSG
jgi:hypothetical protein